MICHPREVLFAVAVDAADEDAAYLALLEARRHTLASGEDDDAIVMDEWTDDEEIESALDETDVFSMLANTMKNMQVLEPKRFQVHVHPTLLSL